MAYTYILLAVVALAFCEVITATILVVGMAHMSDFKRELNTESDVINILAGTVAEQRRELKELKNDIRKNGVKPDKPTIIKEARPGVNVSYICDTCIYGPPSSSDGKPCCACVPDNPLMNCYQGKEDAS